MTVGKDRDGGDASIGLDADAPRLQFHDVWFRYRRSGPDVLQGISWNVPVGRSVLLGPNGAGKTTLLAIGATALTAKRGTVAIGRLDPVRRSDRSAYRREVGWMPQDIRPMAGLTSREQLAYVGWLKGLGRLAAWEQAAKVLARVALDDVADRAAKELSGGQRRRLGLAQALIGDPKVLLLDEPSAGLDPAQRGRFREIMASVATGMTVLVSTHQVDDLDELFDDVVVIHEGALVWRGSVDAFMRLAPPGAVRPAEAAYASLVTAAD